MQKYEYSAFGKIVGIQDGSGNDISTAPNLNTSFTFTGREWDQDAGIYYYRARYYDPNIGRFLQQDPDPGATSRPITVVNKYAYVGNMPTRLTDPTGKFPFLVLFAVMALSGTYSQMHGGNFLGGALLGALAFTGGYFLGPMFAGSLGLSGTSATVVSTIAGAGAGGLIGGYGHDIAGLKTFEEGFRLGAVAGGAGGGLADPGTSEAWTRFYNKELGSTLDFNIAHPHGVLDWLGVIGKTAAVPGLILYNGWTSQNFAFSMGGGARN